MGNRRFCTHEISFGSFPGRPYPLCVHTSVNCGFYLSPPLSAIWPLWLAFGGVDFGDVLANIFLFLESNRPMDQSYAKHLGSPRVLCLSGCAPICVTHLVSLVNCSCFFSLPADRGFPIFSICPLSVLFLMFSRPFGLKGRLI